MENTPIRHKYHKDKTQGSWQWDDTLAACMVSGLALLLGFPLWSVLAYVSFKLLQRSV